MNKICPILLQALTPEQIERGMNDRYNLSSVPKEARCKRFDCIAYDSENNECKHYSSKVGD